MNFISRKKDKLYDGEKEFRFISFNIPDAIYSSHKSIASVFPTPEYEQEDLIKGLYRMGCTVARLYCLSIPGEGVNIPAWNCFIKKPGEYNEDYFLALDKLIEICGRYGIRIILPFVDRYKFIGGVGDYAAFRGKKDDPFSDDFYTDREVIADFKQVLYDVLNRVNRFTGVTYKNDPVILAWETGNELWHKDLYDGWAKEIAGYIKSIDAKHLLLDGFYGVREEALTDENIDIVSSHFYPFHAPDFVVEMQMWLARSKGKKPFIIGEFGFQTVKEIERFLDSVIASDATGALIWSMRQHSIYGGIRHHRENETYCTYHFPGFDEHAVYEERGMVALISEKAREIGHQKEIRYFPDQPLLLPVITPEDIRFLGSTGADSYILERMTDPDSGFEIILEDIKECSAEGTPYASDDEVNGIRYYRVRAVNEKGVSAPSNIQKYEEGK